MPDAAPSSTRGPWIAGYAARGFERWIEWLIRLRAHPMQGVVLGLAFFIIALALRLVSFPRMMGSFPFLPFFPAVTLAAFVGGTRAALPVIVLSVASYFVFHPSALAPHEFLGVALFTLAALVQTGMVGLLTLAAMHLKTERERVAALLETRNAMFRELQHRVANNMQFISSLLAVQQRRFAGSPAGEALEEASTRLRAMSRIHRRLYDPTNVEGALRPLIESLCQEMIAATGAKNVSCEIEIPSLSLPVEQIAALALIVNEAVTNAVKHAFPDGVAGVVRVGLDRSNDSELELRIADNGRGFPAAFDPSQSKSLGMRILSSLAEQLGGALSIRNAGPGAELVIRFPNPA